MAASYLGVLNCDERLTQALDMIINPYTALYQSATKPRKRPTPNQAMYRSNALTAKFFQSPSLTDQLTVDCRSLPGQSEECVLEHVRKALGTAISDDMDHCSVHVKYAHIRYQSNTVWRLNCLHALFWHGDVQSVWPRAPIIVFMPPVFFTFDGHVSIVV